MTSGHTRKRKSRSNCIHCKRWYFKKEMEQVNGEQGKEWVCKDCIAGNPSAPECPDCNGTGYSSDSPGFINEKEALCDKCSGTGHHPPPEQVDTIVRTPYEGFVTDENPDAAIDPLRTAEIARSLAAQQADQERIRQFVASTGIAIYAALISDLIHTKGKTFSHADVRDLAVTAYRLAPYYGEAVGVCIVNERQTGGPLDCGVSFEDVQSIADSDPSKPSD